MPSLCFGTIHYRRSRSEVEGCYLAIGGVRCLKRMMVIDASTTQSSASPVRDVPEICRHEVELVWMSLPQPWAG